MDIDAAFCESRGERTGRSTPGLHHDEIGFDHGLGAARQADEIDDAVPGVEKFRERMKAHIAGAQAYQQRPQAFGRDCTRNRR